MKMLIAMTLFLLTASAAAIDNTEDVAKETLSPAKCLAKAKKTVVAMAAVDSEIKFVDADYTRLPDGKVDLGGHFETIENWSTVVDTNSSAIISMFQGNCSITGINFDWGE